MNFRRLVSAVAALAVAGTCVVTSGVSVLAATETYTRVYTVDFTDYTSGEWLTQTDNWNGASSGGTAPTILTETLDDESTNSYFAWIQGSGNGRGFYSNLPSSAAVTTSKERVTFDFAFWGTATANNGNGYYLIDSSGNTILSLTLPAIYTDTDSCNLLLNGDSTGFLYAKTNWSASPKVWYTFDAVLDFSTATFTYKIYLSSDSTQTAVAESDEAIAFANTSATSLSRIGYYYKGSTSTGMYYYLDNFTTYSVESDAEKYDVTISYLDENDEQVGDLTPQTLENIEDGTSITLSNYYTSPYYYGTNKYTVEGCYDADGNVIENGILNVTETTNVTVKYSTEDKVKYTPTVEAYNSSNTLIGTYTSDEIYEDETDTVYYPAYILASDGKYYSTTARATDSTYPWFAYVVSYSESPITRTYSESNIYYYVEAENMNIDGDNATAQNSYYTGRCSLGAGINLGDSTVAYTDAISDGAIYTVNIAGRNKNRSDSSLDVFLRDSETGDYTDVVETLTWGDSVTATQPVTVYVPAGYQVAISGVSQVASGVDIDYVTLTKVATAMTAVDFSDTAYTLSAGSYDAVDGGTPLTITETQAVNTYLIKISNYVSGVPTITLTDGTTITPTESVGYGYSANGYKYFMIQTLDIDSTPTSVTFGDVTIDVDEFGELTAE